MDDLIIELLKYVATLGFGFALAYIKAKRDERQQNVKDLMVIKGALQSFLRERLLQGYIFYVEKQGWCPYKEKQSLQNMFEWYEQLGSNGIIEEEVKKIMNLRETENGATKEVSDNG